MQQKHTRHIGSCSLLECSSGHFISVISCVLIVGIVAPIEQEEALAPLAGDMQRLPHLAAVLLPLTKRLNRLKGHDPMLVCPNRAATDDE